MVFTGRRAGPPHARPDPLFSAIAVRGEPGVVMSAARDLQAYERAYAASDFEPVQARMRKRKLLEVLGNWRPASVLEIGCGSDPLFDHYREFERFCVVEPGAGFVRRAREQARGDARIEVVHDTMELAAERLAGERFDCIVLAGLLHEVSDCGPLLAAVAASCTQQTRVHVNVPNARSLHRLLGLEMGLIDGLNAISERQRVLQQRRTFDIASLATTCEQAGFRVFERGSYFIKPFTHRQMAQLQQAKLLDDTMLDALYTLERHLPGLGSEVYVHLRLTS